LTFEKVAPTLLPPYFEIWPSTPPKKRLSYSSRKSSPFNPLRKPLNAKERARQLIQIGALVSSHHQEPEKLLEGLKSGQFHITIEETQQIILYYAYAQDPEKVFRKELTIKAGLSVQQILERLKSQAPQKINIYRIEKIAFRIEDPENAGFKLKS